MDALTVSAASGIRSRTESLEMLANNISNQATAGFKTDREFYGIYRSAEGAGSVWDIPSPTLPVIERQWTDFSQGTLTPTGNSLDLALSGTGFFTVEGPNGPLYTRNGQFHLSADGALQTKDGYPVLDSSGSAIVCNPSVPVEVSPNGTVFQADEPVGALGIAEFEQPNTLRKLGGTYFDSPAPEMQPSPATGTDVLQGKLENANFTAAESAVRLVGVMRQFEMLQKAVQLGSEMNRRAIDDVAKVSG